ncbi:EAL domain-containing protein [Deltaproteobacteria bacterium TL4]
MSKKCRASNREIMQNRPTYEELEQRIHQMKQELQDLKQRVFPQQSSNPQIPEFLSAVPVPVAKHKVEQLDESEKLSYLAYHDTLTGLPNRSLLLSRIEQTLHSAVRYQRKFAILYVDLDHFKEINDTRGHQAGDIVLIEITKRVKALLRHEDVLGRIGGDEFVILLSELTNMEHASIVATRVNEVVTKPILKDQQVQLSCSIGISFFPEDGEDGESLLQHADIAMYEAKKSGKNNYKTFMKEYQERTERYLLMKQDIKKAIDRQEFELHYQPKVDVHKQVVGMEALIRWNSPDRGFISPSEFMQVAEESGLIAPIGDWVIYEACRQNKEWQDKGYPPLTMAVNLSPYELKQPDLLGSIENALKHTGLESQYLEMEVDESGAMLNPAKTAVILDGLKKLGVRITIDDFGTGYSSMSQLIELDINALKIDRSFIDPLMTNKKAVTIAKLIINMARSLDFIVIAEGVETQEQFELLVKLGCQQVQGYYIQKPLKTTEFELYLQSLSQP